MKNNMFKLAVIICVVLFAVPSYASISDFDTFGSKTMPGSAYKTELAAFGITNSPLEKSVGQDTKSDEQKKAVEKLRNDLKSDAIREVSGFARLINEQGTIAALETIDKFIQQKGYTSKKGTVNGISYVSYSFKTNTSSNAPDFVYQYSVHPDKKLCQVVTAVPVLKIQEGAAANYTEPATQVSLTESVSHYLGLALSEQPAVINGLSGFKVMNVDSKGLAGKAGMKTGDFIVKIDAFEIRKDHSIDRITSYIDARCNKKALIRVVLMRKGAKKVVNIQL